MNVIDLTVIQELATIVEKVAADAAIKGAVITSGKDTFCAGADLTLLKTMRATFAEMAKNQGEEAAAKMLFEESRKLSQLYRGIETCGKPCVAAINGTALGGGFELCLACHQRVAADNPKDARRPAGNQDRAVSRRRRHAAHRAHDACRPMRCNCCSRATSCGSNRAKAMKLVDNVVPPADLVKTAKDWIKAGGKA